ncbi:MAG: carbon-nitrogen hydrolase family protein [Firmicutes bacterium]|nr:carbon-nitrogen hydrolase family protein [Bacillota bacterium]
MKAAAIQFASKPHDPEFNRQRVAGLINEAAEKGARLLVLPKLWPTGFVADHLPDQAETIREASITLLRRLAKERQIFIVGGSLAEKRDNRIYDSVISLNENGEIAAKYRTTHFASQEEENIFKPGDEWTLTEYAGINIGVLNCYDLYFPEFSRNLALRGAQIFTVPLLINKSIAKARLLARARALENGCFVIMANQARDMAAGQSLIISPEGTVLAKAGPNDEVLIAEMDLYDLAYTRQQRFNLNLRRNILDEIDNSQL